MQRSGRATGKRGDLFNKRAASVWAAAFWQFCKCSEGRPFCAAFHPEFQNLSELMEWFYASKLRLFGDAVNKFFDQNHLQIAYRLLQICSRFEIQTRNSDSESPSVASRTVFVASSERLAGCRVMLFACTSTPINKTLGGDLESGEAPKFVRITRSSSQSLLATCACSPFNDWLRIG